MDNSKTFANWSTEEQKLLLPFVRPQSEAFRDIERTEISTDTHFTSDIVIGDVDGDGDLDLITGNSNEPNRLYFNNGTANPFEREIGKDVNSEAHPTRALALGDIDWDGDLDLIEGNFGATNRVYFNNGSLDPFNNSVSVEIPGTFFTTDIELVDIDGDNDLDLIEANFEEENLIYFNNGTHEPFKDAANTPFSTDSFKTTSIAIGDLNEDGHPDIVFGNEEERNFLYQNLGTNESTFGGFSSGTPISQNVNSSQSIGLGDMDGDGDVDLIAGNTGTPSRLYLNNGTNNPFQDSPGSDITIDIQNVRDVQISDLDGDGDLDLVTGNDGERTRLYLNNGTADPFNFVVGRNIFALDQDNTSSILLRDMDGDGDVDLITGNRAPQNSIDSQTNKLYLNDTSLTEPNNEEINTDLYNTNLGAVASLLVHEDTQPIERVTLQTDSVLPVGTSVDYYVSINGGEKFTKIQPGEFLTFQTVGNNFLWKAVLHSLSPSKTPEVLNLALFKDSITNITSSTEALDYRVKTPALNVLSDVSVQDQDEVLVQKIVISLEREGNAEGDTLGLQGDIENLQVDSGTNTLSFNNTDIGTFTTEGNSVLTVSLATGETTIQADAIQSILKNVTFENQTETRNANTRTLTVTFTDEKGRMIGIRNADSTIVFQFTKTIRTSVNFPPALTVNEPFGLIEDTTTAITSAHLLAEDDLDASQITYTLTSLPGKGVLKNGGLELALTGNNTFTQADINNGQIVFMPGLNLNGEDQFTFTLEDSEGEKLGTPFTFSISITPVNDTPFSQVPDTKTFVRRNGTVVIEGISFTDVDVNETTLEPLLTVTFSVSQGDLTLEGETNQRLTITQTIDELNTLMSNGALSYQPDTGFLGSDTLVIEVNDNGNTGEGGARVSTSTIVIEVFRLLQLNAGLSSFWPDNRISPGEEVQFTLELTNMDQITDFRVVFQLDSTKLTYKKGTATFEGTTRADEWESIGVNNTIPNNLTILEVTGTSRNPLRQGRGTLFSFILTANDSLDQEDLLSVQFNTQETTLNGGNIIYDHEDWIGFTPFLWGDVNRNGTVGALDASFILQSILFETELPVQSSDNYTRIEGTELPLLADVDRDQKVGVNDASLIQDHYTFITDHFSIVDTNTDNFGPDIAASQNISSKAQSRNQSSVFPSNRIEKLLATIEPVSDHLGQTVAWDLIFSIEDSADIRGIFLTLSFNPDHLSFPDNGAEALVNSSALLLSDIDTVESQLKIVSAFSPALSSNDTTLLSVRLNKLDSLSGSDPIFVTVDHKNTQLNDGGITLHPESVSGLNLTDLSASTNISGWMLY